MTIIEAINKIALDRYINRETYRSDMISIISSVEFYPKSSTLDAYVDSNNKTIWTRDKYLRYFDSAYSVDDKITVARMHITDIVDNTYTVKHIDVIEPHKCGKLHTAEELKAALESQEGICIVPIDRNCYDNNIVIYSKIDKFTKELTIHKAYVEYMTPNGVSTVVQVELDMSIVDELAKQKTFLFSRY